MGKIIVIGSLNMDLVTQVKKTPKVGETILGQGFKEIPGGKGANQAVSIGRLGGQVKMIGMVGDDAFGLALTSNLVKNNVDISQVGKSIDNATGLAMIMVNEDGDNSIVVIPGANFDLLKESINDSYVEDYDYVLAQLESPIESIEKAFRIAKEKGLMTILNPAPARELSEGLIRNTDMIIPNETEFELITGVAPENDQAIEKGVTVLFEKGISDVLITLGKKGGYYLNSKGVRHKVSGYSVNAIDTTAAGDSFIGGLLTRLSIGDDIEQAMEYAMKVGAMTVSRKGAQSSLPTQKEIENFEGVKN